MKKLLYIILLSSFSLPVYSGVDPSTGAYTQSISFDVPGYYSIQPKIGLLYNSSFGNGYAGYGWKFSGFSQIDRMGPTKGSPTYTGADIFFLDGQELMLCPPLSSS